MEKNDWLDRIIAELKSTDAATVRDRPEEWKWSRNDASCYELIEEMGQAGYSCLIYTGAARVDSRGPGRRAAATVTYCQLRCNGSMEGNENRGVTNLGVQVRGIGPAATRIAISRAYIALRLRTSARPSGSPEKWLAWGG